MMAITIRVVVKYSSYRKYLEDKDLGELTVLEGTTVRDLVKKIDVPEYYFNQVTINDYNKMPDTVLSGGDVVLIWPPRIGGG